VELYEQIRREYEHGVGTIKGVARKFQVHRRMVREAIGNALPPARKTPVRSRPKMAQVDEFSDGILEAGPESAAKAASHGAPDLGPVAEGMAGGVGQREHGAELRAQTKAGDGAEWW